MRRLIPYLVCVLVFVALGPLLVVPFTAISGFLRNIDFRLLNPVMLLPAALSGYFISPDLGGFPTLRAVALFLGMVYVVERMRLAQVWAASTRKRVLVGAALGLLAGVGAAVPVVISQVQLIRRLPPVAEGWSGVVVKWFTSQAENVAIGVVLPAVVCGAVALCLARSAPRPGDA